MTIKRYLLLALVCSFVKAEEKLPATAIYSIKPFFKALPPRPEAPPALTVDPQKVAQNAMNADCTRFREKFDDQINPLPLVDWLNSSNLPDFFEPTISELLKREEYFNAIDSLGRWNLAAEPYGFHSGFKIEEEQLNLNTLGLTVSGGVTFKEWIVLGAGLGYWHSFWDWDKSNHLNSLSFGPYVGAVFEKGYVVLTLFGVYNMYTLNHLVIPDPKEKIDHTVWDGAARLKGGIDVEWPKFLGPQFFIQPTVGLDYLVVFQNKIEDQQEVEAIEEEVAATINSRVYNFFRAAVDVSFRKEFSQVKGWILIPSLCVGYVLMQPISHSKLEISYDSEKFPCPSDFNNDVKEKAYPSSNQVHVGAKMAAIDKRGWMIALEGDAYLADLYPVYKGDLRLEWSW